MKNKLFFWSLISGIALFGCKKFVDINPPITEISNTSAFANATSAAAVLTNIYANMEGGSYFTDSYEDISLLEGLAADELTNYSVLNTQYEQYYTNTLNSLNSDPGWWGDFYNSIYTANAVIEGVGSSNGISSSMKNQLIGEAEFVRAFCHFYATITYGPVPIVTKTNYQSNNTIKRSPQTEVFTQVVSDLSDALNRLSNSNLDPYGNVTNDHLRPNRATASALLSRVYLYMGNQWASADSLATSIINSGNYALDSNLNNVFLTNSSESIWQLQPINPGYNTWDAQDFILTSPPGNSTPSVSLSDSLVQSFEPGDLRLKNWVGVYTADSVTFYHYPNKYKIWIVNPSNPPSEYLTVFRLAEQYLIRAEARVNEGNLAGAQADLNIIRNRAGLSNTSANDQASLLLAIMHERRTELFTEWGHRWFDLLRTGNINSLMGSPGNLCQNKGGTWNTDWELMPVPANEIQNNPNLTQNQGYSN